ncbi:MAG TPA: hypothetical protein VF624_18210 [Tepidisphaeraceae bacterium]|jgi:hypothetical protein
MTIAELITQLKELPPKATVLGPTGVPVVIMKFCGDPRAIRIRLSTKPAPGEPRVERRGEVPLPELPDDLPA